MIAVLCLLPLAYVLGTLPSAALIARRRGIDVTTAGSGNPGASNVTRLLGWRAGALVLAADVGKGALAAGVGLAIDGHRGAYLLGVAAVVGHVFPVMRHFRGGRGVATGGGTLLVVFPVIGIVLALMWFVVSRLGGKASVASLLCAGLFPVLVAVTGGSAGDIAVTGGVALLVLVRHLGNLRRLLRGEEHGI